MREELSEQSPCSPQAAVRRARKQLLGPVRGTAAGSHQDGWPRLRKICFPRLPSSLVVGQVGQTRPRPWGHCLELEVAEQPKPIPKNTHRPSWERSCGLAYPDHLPLAPPAEQRPTPLQPVSISCTNSLGVRGQLGRRTNTLQTFSPGLPGRRKTPHSGLGGR